MLRLLAGVTRPTTGTVVTRGRVAPLLSVGVGFHPEMTGRENIYVNGMLLGFGRSRIGSLFDEIVDFSDLGDFINTPVKFYSSGMYMRLGFSVAMHVEPDILLVDEVLAVGDIGFRFRSIDRMREMHKAGTALVFVSHFLHDVQRLCPRALCMHQGSIVYDGQTEGAIGRYHELLSGEDDTESVERVSVRVLHRELVGLDGAAVGTVRQDEPLVYRLRFRFEEQVHSPQILFQVYAEDGTFVYQTHTVFGEAWCVFAPGQEARLEVRFLPRFGGGGTFRNVVVVTDIDGFVTFVRDVGLAFFVEPRRGTAGIGDLEATITIDEEDRTFQQSMRFGTHRAAVQSG
jgi:ABC-2 type transport system ATP-binding protein